MASLNFACDPKPARLIPALQESNQENKATSITLATLCLVRPFAKQFVDNVNLRFGKRTTLSAFTEIVLKGQNKRGGLRPDGLLEISTGQSVWRAFVEAKVNHNALGKDQVEAYLKLARDNGVDAVITISNQFAALPTHHPVQVDQGLLRKVALYHMSWKAIFTHALLAHAEAEFSNHHEAEILHEFLEFMNTSKSGMMDFNTMNAEWTDLVRSYQHGGPRSKHDDVVINSVAAWHQELKDMALRLSAHVGRLVDVKLSRKHINDGKARLDDDSAILHSDGVLNGILEIPNAENIEIEADVRARTVRVKCRIEAPLDKVSTAARVSWLLRQLKDVKSPDILIGLGYPGKGKPVVFQLSELQKDHKEALEHYTQSPPTFFEVSMVKDLAGAFAQRKKFIVAFESLVETYYKQVGQNVQDWVAPPPKFKPKPKDAVLDDGSSAESEREPVQAAEPVDPVQQSHNLREIPGFLMRI